MSELRDLLPVTRQTSTTAVRRVVISLEGDGARLLREDGAKLTAIHIDGADDTPVPVSRAIDMVAAMAPRLPVGIRVPQESCFTRTIPLPATARRDFARILALDLERSTPLRPADIYTAHIVDGVATTKGMLDVRHFMLKRRTIDPVVSELAARGLRPIFADCWSADRRSAVPVNFLNDPTDQHRGGGVRVVSLLGCTALLLGLTATLLLRSKQAEALATLDTATAQLSEQARAAGAVRERSVAATRTADQLARLLAGRRPAVQLIEELSRLLPDHTHLTALRLDGDSIEISGLTPSAAALLPLLEGSELFHDARLAAPVQLESEKDRERFQIAAKLRRAGDATPTRGRP